MSKRSLEPIQNNPVYDNSFIKSNSDALNKAIKPKFIKQNACGDLSKIMSDNSNNQPSITLSIPSIPSNSNPTQ